METLSWTRRRNSGRRAPGSHLVRASADLFRTLSGLWPSKCFRTAFRWCPRGTPKIHCSPRFVPASEGTSGGTRWRSSSGSTRHRKTSPAAQREGLGSRWAVIQRRREPTQRQDCSGTTVSGYGHLPVCTSRGDGLRTEWEPPYTTCSSTRQSRRLFNGLLLLPTRIGVR